MSFLGVWYAIGLSSIGLNFGFLIGVIAGCLSFIPYVGSITAFVFSIIIAIVQGWPHIHLAVEAIALVTIGLVMDGYVLSPRLVGASVGLHPVWIMFALLSFGALFGFTGLIVAVPTAAAIGAVMRFWRGAIKQVASFEGMKRRSQGPGADERATVGNERSAAARFANHPSLWSR